MGFSLHLRGFYVQALKAVMIITTSAFERQITDFYFSEVLDPAMGCLISSVQSETHNTIYWISSSSKRIW